MAKERKKRYKEKISYAMESIEKLRAWLLEAGKEEKSFAASAKTFQELAEALTDIFAMLVKDSGNIPKDDYMNIEKLKEKRFLSEEEAKICMEANGLRNVLVHKYNHVDKELFIERASFLITPIRKIIEKIETRIR